MGIINGIKSYINDNELKIVILNNKINISNYTDIGHFDLNKIIIKSIDKNIIINGKNLVISKLLENEILIIGQFNSLELR